LHRRLAELAAEGVIVGLSTSGPDQGAAIRAALAVTVDGEPLFRAVQATWNLLETSAGQALSEAHDAGWTVTVKEVVANGRLAGREPGQIAPALEEVADDLRTTPDAVAIAAALAQPWVTIALSGAATTTQLASNLAAVRVNLRSHHLERLASLVEPPVEYWRHRSGLRWT
jgi:aryl-alcohol dehydrogenase-like predicted oxidoreductase